ncbi:hypothetical protein DIS18_06145 [Algibacter marinivivus]|uniref:Uncharacterized protein n=1 Tax=Algibacter marinivivus TaxID=2100723 RepID=A0A2U2X8N0_9FLAO|nr:hypothetical protein [Algibacter marinivivus]PWH84121.1 hypothetical protein DIS18_06145 [Algibacter marinivivus]
MFAKPLYILSFLLLFSACKKTQEITDETEIEQTKSQEITELDVSKLKYIEYALDSKTEDIIADWDEYIQVEDLVADIKKGDLTFFDDSKATVKLLLRELKDNIPEQVNSPSITARVLVLETKILKLESLTNLSTTSKEELLETIKEFFVSFYTLSFQMNKKVEFDNRSIERP